MQVYLDNAATTRLDERVLDAMLPFLRESYGNASSPHGLGRKARFAVEDARERIAAHLGAEPGEIVFTSGGTEANNLAIWGGLEAVSGPLVTGSAEHESVLDTARAASERGHAVTFIDPREDGSVALGDATGHLDGEAGLVSLMHTNNETGALNPVREIAAACRERGWLMHTDAVQALGWSDLNVDDLGVDLLTISAHKISGPKGVGVLFVRADTVDVPPLVRGGSQERRRRGGTENVAGIVGFAKALDLIVESRESYREHLAGLKGRLLEAIQPLIDEGAILNSPHAGAPHIVNLSFPGLDGEMLLLNLDVAGFSVSSGSACTSGTVEPSHVLRAMDRSEEAASAAVRVSLGRDNTSREMDSLAKSLADVVGRMTPAYGSSRHEP